MDVHTSFVVFLKPLSVLKMLEALTSGLKHFQFWTEFSVLQLHQIDAPKMEKHISNFFFGGIMGTKKQTQTCKHPPAIVLFSLCSPSHRARVGNPKVQAPCIPE